MKTIKSYPQSLLWYKRLKAASPKEREEYEISTIGIHWRKLDEDVSFESFEYDESATEGALRECGVVNKFLTNLEDLKAVYLFGLQISNI